jgi:hypothetical protein
VLATAAGPLGWNAILRATHASQFFTDAPLRLLPASWQDTGSGVFALAATAVLLGVGLLAGAPARRTIGLAALCGLAAFLVDVYLYQPSVTDGAPAGNCSSRTKQPSRSRALVVVRGELSGDCRSAKKGP